MEILLEKSAYQSVDAGMSAKFTRLTFVARPNGFCIRASDAARSVLVEHYIDRMFTRQYTPGRPFSIPYLRVGLPGTDRVHLRVQGSVLVAQWSGKGLLLERHIYLLENEAPSMDESLAPPSLFTIGLSVFQRLIKMTDSDLEVNVGKEEVVLQGVSSTGLSIVGKVPSTSRVAGTFILPKVHLEKVPKYLGYISVSMGADERGVVVMSLEMVGVVTTITVACAVVFFNAS
ncbi:hypothetical protein NEHOM01_0673 [Nematocida homosporus]|uniref:uncharacterized protein n=1 Tax=Nematocida homosporus TaxID=1912981 RepID=UPI00221E5F45|nr:uncharacterized protein NEHOM01_0673 [Nematocida homosporus]KAI5185215.1 hypothetical protein NEHOM01_0673 [Nematocida homosporus]